MLRRKLMLVPGFLVLAFVILAVIGIWQLQIILRGLDHISWEAETLLEGVSALSTAITATEAELHELQLGRTTHPDRLADRLTEIDRAAAALADHYLNRPDGDAADPFQRIVEVLPRFKTEVAFLAALQDSDLASRQYLSVLDTSMDLRSETMALARITNDHLSMEQLSVTRRFKRVLLALTVLALIAINVTVMVLWRMTGLVLRPVEKLVEASRRLGDEHFDYRVQLEEHDEFDELAQAYNRLAEKLQAHERRKVEALQQFGRTLNHELNNALSIIGLKLQLLDRRTGGDEARERHIRQIREVLAKMTRTVGSLKQLRRIVLTDYVPGQKMLDLEQSVVADQPEVQVRTARVRETDRS